ncbi:MAG: orotidine-5'-phosphate decarboxylase [Rhodocyclaceae bacterium]|nr:orotidine-5'-phosphate decarboxylase [Rhodocyclaceae bacterium]
MSSPEPRIVVALDYAAAEPALALARRLDPLQCRLKVGKELFTAAGPDLVRALAGMGFGVFLDLKFHDIPNTVASACRAAAGLGVWMVNVHASGGTKMLRAAREAIDIAAPDPSRRPLLIAVTVLTSMTRDDLVGIGLDLEPREQALRLAQLAAACGLDGVVCSAQEAAAIKAACGSDFRCVTPGIRPAGSAAGDQARIMTPAAAVAAGADDLVIGRPITAADDPAAALAAIVREIGG